MTAIVKYQPQYLVELTEFVVKLNQQPNHHIGYFGTTNFEVNHALQRFFPSPEECIKLVLEENQIIGMLATDTDPDLERAWLYGPLINNIAWHHLAQELFEAVDTVLPNAITELEIFADIRNIDVLKFAVRNEFELLSTQHVLQLEREKFNLTSELNVQKLTPEYYQQFEQLHDYIFPRTYFSGQEILAKLDEQNQVFILIENKELMGYVYGMLELDINEANLEFVSVVENKRGKGYGKTLVQAMAAWAFSYPSVEKVRLTVDAENKPAFSAYKKIGFTLERALLAYRKNRAD